MILQGNFYTLETLDRQGDNIAATIQLDAGHAIFSGHFPGQPVVPGVCMMQLVKEIVEAGENTSLSLVRADTLKFLRVIDPRVNAGLRVECRCQPAEDGTLRVSADLFAGDDAAFRMKALFAQTII